MSKDPFFRFTESQTLNQYGITYSCDECGYQDLTSPLHFKCIPPITPPRDCGTIAACQLFDLGDEHEIQTNCGQCNHEVTANSQFLPGDFTVLAVNRTEYSDGVALPFNDTKIGIHDAQEGDCVICDKVTKNLICVVSHRRGDKQHWVTYTECDDFWYLNDDDKKILRCNYHPLDSPVPSESVVLLVFDNR